MRSKLILVFLFLPLNNCGSHNFSTIETSVTNADETKDNESEEDHRPWEDSPPVMIIGANLTCDLLAVNSEEKFLEVSCFFEKDRNKVSDLSIEKTDIIVNDNMGEDLLLEFSSSEGVFSFKSVLRKENDLNIYVVTINGVAIPGGKRSVVIKKEKIQAVLDAFEEPGVLTPEPKSKEQNQILIPESETEESPISILEDELEENDPRKLCTIDIIELGISANIVCSQEFMSVKYGPDSRISGTNGRIEIFDFSIRKDGLIISLTGLNNMEYDIEIVYFGDSEVEIETYSLAELMGL